MARAATPPLSTKQQNGSEQRRLVAALRRLPDVGPSSDRARRREPAVRVIDCVLSLNRNYDKVVVPMLDRFEQQHPEVRSIRELQALITRYSSCNAFVEDVLDYHDADCAATLRDVVNWLVTVGRWGLYEEQLSNLQLWASEARPTDYQDLGIRGFGLAGFQYLRMLFGANTTKPDVHICQYVADFIGRRVSDVEALGLLERAAAGAGLKLPDLDTTIWENAAR